MKITMNKKNISILLIFILAIVLLSVFFANNKCNQDLFQNTSEGGDIEFVKSEDKIIGFTINYYGEIGRRTQAVYLDDKFNIVKVVDTNITYSKPIEFEDSDIASSNSIEFMNGDIQNLSNINELNKIAKQIKNQCF